MGLAKYAEDNLEILVNRRNEGRSLATYVTPYFYQNGGSRIANTSQCEKSDAVKRNYPISGKKHPNGHYYGIQL